MRLFSILFAFAVFAVLPFPASGQTYLFPTSPAPSSSINQGGFSPNYFGAPYPGYSAYGYGLYGPGYFGPGYYGPGASGVGGYSPYGVDPSLYFHTYPSNSSPSLSPPLLNSGLPSLMSPYGAFPRIRIAPTTWPSRGKITLLHAADAAGDVTYSLNGTSYAIKPGYVQTFDDDRKWIVSLGESEGKKELRYTLTAGSYRFLSRETFWDLGEVVAKKTPHADK